MTFVAGVLVGVVVGLGAGIALGRRARPPDPPERHRSRKRARKQSPVAIGSAALAIVVAGLALAQSLRHDDTRAAAPSTSAAPTTASPSGPSTTDQALEGAVSVPDVVGLARNIAVASLETHGLTAAVSTLALTNVPQGFVVTQRPLPAAHVPAGTIVALVVSAAA